MDDPPVFFHQPSPPPVRDLIATSPFKQKHIVSINQFTKADVNDLLQVASSMKQAVESKGVLDMLSNKILCTMFYEPSTRTSASFDASMQRLGGRTIPISVAHSSTVKGETLQDSIRTLASYGDAIVLRHPSNDSADVASRASPVPIINGGNGSREHPTQAFLDLFTITQELGHVEGSTVTFLGDLKYGRTVHSLSRLLAHYNVTIQLVSPSELKLPRHVRGELEQRGVRLVESEELTPEILGRTDVLYCTRVQQERFADPAQYEQLKDSFIVNRNVLRHAKSSSVIMHPLPRKAEVSEEVDSDPRAAYFRQMRYGLFTRMALLAMVLA
ncbi:MAG: hypothetical protein Q9162_004268 [Coniocarpon cinnabarinum]